MVSVMFLSVPQDKRHIVPFFELLVCVNMAKHRCFFVSFGGAAHRHWKTEKPATNLCSSHTLLAERQTSNLSLLYYPDARAPLGNEVLYIKQRHKTGGKQRPPSRRVEEERPTWGSEEVPGGLGQTLHLSQLGPEGLQRLSRTKPSSW